jgi:hypothetical protein
MRHWLEKNASLLTLFGGIVLYVIAGIYQVGVATENTRNINAKVDDLNKRIDRIEVLLMERR